MLVCSSTALPQAFAQDEFGDEFDDGYDDVGDGLGDGLDDGVRDEYAEDAPDNPATDPTSETSATSETSPTPDDERGAAFRMHNSWRGPTGGVHLIDAGSGLPGSFRVQLGFEGFSASDFLEPGDEHSYVGGVLSFSWTIVDHLEVFAAIANHASSNSLGDPVLLQVLGDTMLGGKGYYEVLPWLILGGDLSLIFLNAVGDIGLVTEGTSFSLGFNMSADLRKLESPTPLILRFNLGYFFDNSSNLIEDVENARYEELTDPAPIEDETRHLLDRQERYGLGINRVDHLRFALGIEAPLQVTDGFYLQPLAEYVLDYSINRQGYVCLVESTDASVGQPDGCLEFQGLAAMPTKITLGVRAFPPLNGLGLMLAFDIGLSGVSTFVRELHANSPYKVLFSMSYAYDTAPVAAPMPAPAPEPVIEAPPPKTRISGLVVEQGLGDPIAGAIVRYEGMDLTDQATDEGGRFVSYGMDPGDVLLAVSHPDYEPRTCSVTIPEQGTAAPEGAATEGAAPEGAAPEGAPAQNAPAPGGLGPVTADGQAVIEPAPSGASAEAQLGVQSGTGAQSETVEADAVGGIGRATGEPAGPGAAGGDGAAATGESSADGTAGGTSASRDIPTVDLRCELVARPRFGHLTGSVTDASGAPVASASITVTGPTSAELISDASGQFRSGDLAAGSYGARIDADGYLLKQTSFTIAASRDATISVQLEKKPKNAQVSMSQQEVKIRRQIMFKSNSAEIDEKSFPLLSEIADVLLRNPQVTRVEIQGHTDNRGDSAANKNLSQLRAESVMGWLVEAGVDAGRLTARGYGDLRPLVPNLTPGNRARNRRVQFMILEQN